LQIASPIISLSEVTNTEMMIRFTDAHKEQTGGAEIISYEIEYASTFGIFNHLATVPAGVNYYL
jgi:hypothetical protein